MAANVVTSPVPISGASAPCRVVAVPRAAVPLGSAPAVWTSRTSPALPIFRGSVVLAPAMATAAPAVPVRAAGLTTAKGTAAAPSSAAGALLACGLCRQSTGDNLANYFNQGRRRMTEAPKVEQSGSLRSPGRRPSHQTSLSPEACGPVGLQPASPRGAVQVWAQTEPPGLTRLPAKLHHGPNPLDLPADVAPHRRMSHGEGSPSPREAPAPSSARPASARDCSSTSPRRTLSSDAAHRQSMGVWSCIDVSMSDGEDPRRPVRRRPQQQSSGAARGMQLQAKRPETLQENPSGEEDLEGFPKARRGKERRHLSPKAGDGGGDLADGLSSLNLSESTKEALGVKSRGRRSAGAKEYCSRRPGPWEALPKGTVQKDGWGRLTRPTSPRAPARAPYGTDADQDVSAEGTRASRVRRFYSAPPLPYGTEADVPDLSQPPKDGLPLGLGLAVPEVPLPGAGCDAGSGGSHAEEVAELADLSATGGSRMLQAPHSARSWRPAAASKASPRPRAVSADARRVGKPLMSSAFVVRQRQSSHFRGGSMRLASGGNLAPQLNRQAWDQPPRSSSARQALGQGLKTRLRAAKPTGQLDEAYNKCLQSISEEIEQLQSRCLRIEREVQKTRVENGMLKCRPQEGAEGNA